MWSCWLMSMKITSRSLKLSVWIRSISHLLVFATTGPEPGWRHELEAPLQVSHTSGRDRLTWATVWRIACALAEIWLWSRRGTQFQALREWMLESWVAACSHEGLFSSTWKAGQHAGKILSACWFIHQSAVIARAGPGWCEKPRALSLPLGCPGTTQLSHHLLPPRMR